MKITPTGEALGARAMRGVADNLDASLTEKCTREGWHIAEDRQNAPLADALSMLVRERISGRPAPDAAKGLMKVWRDDLEEAAGGALPPLEALRPVETAEDTEQLSEATTPSDV